MKARENVLVQAGLAAIAALGVLLLVFSTHWGPGVGGDAAAYIYSARNFLAGRGLGLLNPQGGLDPLSYYPPLFPLALSLVGLPGLELTGVARWLNILLFAGLIWLSGDLLYRTTRSKVLAWLLALLVMASPSLITVYSWAMSEPLALLLGFGGLALLLAYLRRPAGRTAFYLSALAVGLSIVTRYAAAPFLAAGALGVLLLSDASIRQRIRQAVVYGVVGALPLLAWLGWDYLQTATLASRNVGSKAPLPVLLSSSWSYVREVVLEWLLPSSWLDRFASRPHLLTLALALLALGALAWLGLVARKAYAARAEQSQQQRDLLRWLWLSLIFAGLYLVFTLLTYYIVYPTIDLNSRILSPLYVAVLWALAALAGLSLDSWPGLSWLRRFLPLAALLLVAWLGWRSVRVVQQNYALGLGYNTPVWRSSPILQAVQDIPPNTPIVTNDMKVVLFLAGRPSYFLLELNQTTPTTPYTRYGDGALSGDESQQAFRDGAALVLFSSADDQFARIYGAQTADRLAALTQGLRVAYQGDDGAIYYYPTP